MKRILRIKKEHGIVADRHVIGECVNTWLDTAANGDYLLELHKDVRERSTQQNALMWMWFGIIAQNWSEACGYAITSQDAHDAYCLKFLPKDTPSGKVPGSTRTLNKDQMREFMDKVQADAAAEYGIRLPNEQDRLYDAYFN